MPPKTRNKKNNDGGTPEKDPRPKRKGGAAAKKQTPPKKSKPTNPYKSKKYYAVYTLVSGDIESFEDLTSAMEFQADHEALIASSERFDTKAKMMAFIKTSKKAQAIKTEQDGDTPATQQIAMSPEDKTKLNRIKDMMDAARPCDSWTFYYKTTPKSNIVIVIFVALNQWNENMWFVKRQLQSVLVNYFKTNPTDNNFVNDILTNVQSVKMRDKEKGPNAQLEIIGKDKRKYAQSYLWSWANLPETSFASMQDEDNLLDEQFHETMTYIRSAQRTPLFMAVVKQAYSENMFNAMINDTKNSSGFTTFFQNCRVSTAKISNLNTFVILDEVKTMQMFLWKNSGQNRKYPPTPVPVTNHESANVITPDLKKQIAKDTTTESTTEENGEVTEELMNEEDDDDDKDSDEEDPEDTQEDEDVQHEDDDHHDMPDANKNGEDDGDLAVDETRD